MPGIDGLLRNFRVDSNEGGVFAVEDMTDRDFHRLRRSNSGGLDLAGLVPSPLAHPTGTNRESRFRPEKVIVPMNRRSASWH